MSELITLGESLVMFAPEKVGKLSEMSFFHKYLAGAELNVAVGVARLGHSVSYLTQIGRDSFGDFTLTELEKLKIDVEGIRVNKNYSTGFYLKEKVEAGDPKVEYYRKNSAASHYLPAYLDAVKLNEIKIAHLTGIMAGISADGLASVEKMLRLMNTASKTTIFDPNIRPALWESQDKMIQTLNQLAAQAKIVLPGVNEGSILTGSSVLTEIADFYLNQSQLTEVIIIKNGSQGAFVKTKSGQAFTVSGFKVSHVVDTVGAGDGFAVGLIAGLLDNQSLYDSVRQACAVGAFAVQSAGDNEGYPKREILKEFLEKEIKTNEK
jgi:2-dehydro-3-deoxygluconokinase